MPWLNDSRPHKAGPQKLQLVLKRGFTELLPATSLADALRQLRAQYLLSPGEAARVLFDFRSKRAGADDPLLFDYMDTLLSLQLVDVSSLLVALLEASRFSKNASAHDLEPSYTGMPTCEERVFTVLMQKYATGSISLERSDLHGLVYAFARWFHAVTEHEMGKQLHDGALHTIDVFSFNMYEALASLALTILSDPRFRSVATQSWWRKRRITLVNEMRNLDTHVLQWMQQSPLAGRLQLMTTFPPFLETDEHGNPVFTDAQILQYIQDLPVSHTRAGLYIWLDACLYSRPYTDDSSMIMYLQARYAGNIQGLVVDLITASFDTLTNTLRRNEPEQSIKIVKSFICNKLPLLLSIVSGALATAASVEAFIQVAFATIAMEPLPPISAGATEVGEKLKATRLEFLQTCILHGIASEQTVAAILPGSGVPSPKTARYTKENLMAKHAKDISSIERLLEELDAMNGNAGAVATFIVETMNGLCVNSDTINLKVLCNMLVKKIAAVDIILQYASTAALLLPLCNQMNNWTHDQEQAEFTSGYEEFASMLLFVLAVVHRYGLTANDIGLQSHDSFVSRLLRDTPKSHVSANLNEEQNMQLSKWIEGLYATDDQDETSGISDETMRGCPPQAFYELVPTLLEQSVMACKSGSLSLKALQGGLELLVMPLLLPSLVPGLNWLINHSWEDSNDGDILLQVLDKLLKPSSDSPDATSLHKTILGIIADPLFHSLQTLAQKQSGKKFTGLAQILKPFLGQSRVTSGDKSEIKQWMATPEGGITTALRNAIREQVAWVTDIGPTPPPKYTHRLYAMACETVGVDSVLDAIIAELKEQTKVGNGSYTIDICTALVSAPTSASPAAVTVFPSANSQSSGGAITTRDALHLRSNNLQRLLKTSASDAESLVRLVRRVDAQLVVTQMPQIPLALPLQNQETDQLMADLGLGDENLAATAAAAAAQDASMKTGVESEFNNADLAAVLDQSIDMTDAAVQNLANLSSDPNAIPTDPTQNIFDDLGMQIPESLSQMVDAGASNAVDQNAGGVGMDEDDIFEGLDMSNIEDFNFS